MKSDAYQQVPEMGLVGSAIEWTVQKYNSAVQLINEDQDRTNMVATMMLLLLFVWGWVYTSLTQSKNPRLQRIERKVQESHKSMSTIMDTLHLIKNAHENNVKCDQLVGQHLIDCLAHGHLDDAHSESDKPDQDMLGMIENVEKEIHEIQHSKVRLTSRLPTCFSTSACLAEYPSVCERLLKHQLLSETEPDLTDCQSSSNAEQTSNGSCRTESKLSKPVISSPLKCVSSAVNEIEAKTLPKPCTPIGSRRSSQQTRSMLPRTVTRKNALEKNVI